MRFGIGATLLVTHLALAQVTSPVRIISLMASKQPSIALGLPTPSAQTVDLVDGAVNAFPTPFNIPLSWDLANAATTRVYLVAYFASPAQAFANGTDYLTSSRIEVSTDNGTTWQPFTGSAVGGVGSSGGSRLLYTSPVTQGEDRQGHTIVTFLIRINLVGQSPVAAGVYTATLNLISVAY
jgi:hypothetical protein